MMAMGCSVRGLSDVIMAKSAYSTPILPIMGRFMGSRSPPQPKTEMSLPLQKPLTELSTFSSPSGEWA